jgi:CubicO group peptidase (beta-lactamase class C family)
LSYSEVYGGEQEILFNVASLAKPVTASITLKRVEQDLLSLDKPLYPYWVDTDLARDSRVQQLTPRILRSHQSGFKNWRSLNADNKLHFDFDSGKGYSYSGEGYEYLRRALKENLVSAFKNWPKKSYSVLLISGIPSLFDLAIKIHCAMPLIIMK